MNGSSDHTAESMIDGLQEQLPAEAQQKLETAEREAKAAMASVRDKSADLARRMKAQIEERPYLGMGISLGVGMTIGALLGSRAMRIAVIGAVGYLISRVPLSEMTAKLDETLSRKGGAGESKHRRTRPKQG